MTTTHNAPQHPEHYRPEPSGRFAVDLTTLEDEPRDGGKKDGKNGKDGKDASRPAPPEPKAAPHARGWTVLLGLVLLGVTAVIVRDILIVTDTVGGTQLLPPVFDWFATVQQETWMLWAGIGCAVVALIFLIVTLRPRSRTHLAFDDDTALFARPVDVARLSTAAARRVPGVLTARSVATRKKISVTVETAVTPDSAGAIRDTVAAQVNELAGHLTSTPTVDVSVSAGGEGK